MSGVEARNRCNRPVDLVVAVREREEHRLELGRRDVDAAREQVPEQRAVPIGVAALHVLEAPDRAVGHEQRQHRADAAHAAELREPSLEARAASLELVELSPHAVRGAELGLAARPEPERARSAVVQGDAAAQTARIARADAVIVDPPRRGLDRALLEALVATPPATLVYVSCGLDSFLADAERLLASGRLALRALEAFALFAYTEHAESLAVFAAASGC